MATKCTAWPLCSGLRAGQGLARDYNHHRCKTSVSDAETLTICGVQQDGGLADDPALLAAEADAAETVIEALITCGLQKVSQRAS